MIGRTAREIFRTNLGEEAYQRHLEVMRSARLTEYDLVLDLHGESREVRTTLSPVLDPDGTVVAIIGSSVVLSDLRASEQNRIEAMALLERARAEMDQYLAFAAHDLRAPMRRMSGLAALIQEELPESAEMMEQVCHKAQSLISEVLSFSEANNAKGRVETFDLQALARDIFVVLDPLHRHELTAEAATLSGDKVVLQIVLRNLVDNAIKYTDRDIVRLHIALEDRQDGLAICVADNGPGLPDADMRFLEGTGFEYGTGFGLLGIRRLVGTRGGRLSAALRTEGGTIFRISLPSLERISG